MKFSIVKKTGTYSLLNKRNIMFSILFVLTNVVSQAQVYNFQQLRERVFNSQSKNIADNAVLDNWINTQNPDGSWPDVIYGKLSKSVSIYDNHVFRLWNLAAACSKASYIKYNNAIYKDAIKRGLLYWYNSNTIDPNWWFNKIFFPQKLGELLIFMRVFDGYIPKTTSIGIDEPEILSLFKPTAINDITYNGSGANAIDIATHYVYRGLLTQDSKLLEDTKNKLELILADNITDNLVYQDHGPQIMIASYGLVYCDGLMRLVSYLAESPAAFDTKSSNFEKVLRFIRETQLSSIRGKSWDFSVLGRGVSRENATDATINYLQSLADQIDPANASIYLEAISGFKGNNPANFKVREFNKHYWDSDYTQHSRNGFLFTVRNTSSRTVESEVGNGENLKANYFSYGANFISVDGDEYKNIMPVWDWSMIPGTTFPYLTSFPARENWGSNYGKTNFVGGVSDGAYGVSVLDLDNAGIKAKKSWFFFDDEIVCLGAAITDNSNREVRTTINQTWMKEPSSYNVAGNTNEITQSISSSVYANTNLKYIRNGKIGYYFPNQGNIKYKTESQSGTWESINTLEGSSTLQTGNVFSLWIDHGSNPKNASYIYIVVPGIDNQQKAQNYNANDIQIIQNTSAIQAVYNKKLEVLEVVFYQTGKISLNEKTLRVNKPCALIFKKGTLITVSDPSQKNSKISITIKINGTKYTKKVVLPTNGATKGASTTVDFNVAY
jgi:chondroitin AC lyase